MKNIIAIVVLIFSGYLILYLNIKKRINTNSTAIFLGFFIITALFISKQENISKFTFKDIELTFSNDQINSNKTPNGENLQRATSTIFNSELEETASKHINIAKDYFNSGEHDFLSGSFKDAITNYQKSIKSLPTMSAFLNLGNSFYHLSNLEEAQNTINTGLQIAQGKENEKFQKAFFNNLGVINTEKGEYDLAIKYFNKSLEISPNDSLVYNNRGTAYGERKKYDLAVKDFNEAIKINPKYAIAYINRGNAYDKKGEYDLAISDYNKAIDLNPSAVFYYHRATTNLINGKYDLAIKDLNEAIKINPKYAIAYNHRGNAYVKKGEYDLAIIDYNKAIELNPSADFYYNRGNTWFKKGNYDKALNDFQSSIKLNPNLALAYFDIAKIYKNKNLNEKAKFNLRKAIELDPNIEYIN